MTAYLAVQEDDFPVIDTSSIQSRMLNYVGESISPNISVGHGSAQMITVLLSTAAREYDYTLEYKNIKRYWSILGATVGRTIGVISGESMDILKDTVTSLSVDPVMELTNHLAESTRGVYLPLHDRQVLFSSKIKFRIADLPKWEPQISFISQKKRKRNAR